MMTFLARGGSLAALAAALALTLPSAPAAAQDLVLERDVSGPAQVSIAPPPRAERAPRPERAAPRVDTPRPERAAPRFERAEAQPRPERAAPRFDQAQARPRPERPAPRGFGGEVADRVRAAQQQAEREQRADRIDRRSEQRADRVDQRFEQRATRVEQRGDVEARRLEWRGRDQAAERVDRRTDWRADRIEQRGDVRADRIEDRGDARADRVDRRGGAWQGGPRAGGQADGRVGDIRARGGRDGRGAGGFEGEVGDIARDARRADQRGDWRRDDDRRGEWRGDGNRRDGWRGDRDRRDGWRGDRRDWRRDDWRWGWNGRPGWDRRDFRRWDHRWRGDRRYDWLDFRSGNRFAFRPGPYFAPFRSHRYSRLQTGFFLDSLFFQPRFFINDPWAYHLPPVYGPFQWVRYYDDVVLVDIYTGEVVDVIHDFFW